MRRTVVNRVAAVALAAVMGFLVAGWVLAQDAPKADESKAAAPAPEAKAPDAEAKAPAVETPAVAESKPPAGINWVADLSKAQEKAKAESKLVFIDFRADWCGFCKMLDEQTFTDAKVAAALNEMVPVRVDTDKEEATRDKFEVGPIPALIITSDAGDILARAVGFMPAEKFLDFIAFAKAKQVLAKDPKDAAAASIAAQKSIAVQMDDAERGKLAATALELNPKAPNDVKAKLLILRGQSALGDEQTKDAGMKDVEEAAKLDPENAAGVKEMADWITAVVAFQKSQDVAAFGAAAEAFLKKYPLDKIKDKMLHASVLNLVFRHRVSTGDLNGAIVALEALKADHKDMIDPERIDDVIKQIKVELAKKEAAEAVKQGPAEQPKEGEEPKKPEEPKTPEEPKSAE